MSFHPKILLNGRVNPSVVNITTFSSQSGQLAPLSQGSGFVYDTNGHIVTNAHVIHGVDEVEVNFADSTARIAEIIGEDLNSDLAVVRVNPLPEGVDPHRGYPCHCQLGNVYQVLAAYGLDVDKKLPWIRPWFLRYQMADGGLNCDNDAYLATSECPSSMVGTIAAFEAVLRESFGLDPASCRESEDAWRFEVEGLGVQGGVHRADVRVMALLCKLSTDPDILDALYEDLRLADLLDRDAHGAGRHLHPADGGDLVGLHVRPVADAVPIEVRLHAPDVRLHDGEVDGHRRGLQVAHIGHLGHGASSS